MEDLTEENSQHAESNWSRTKKLYLRPEKNCVKSK
jgi:hypothetical protein